MTRNVKKYLLDLLGFIDELEVIMEEAETFEQLEKDAKGIRAVEHLFQLIGEAVRRIRDEAPNLPITDSGNIIAMRNLIAHQYEIIDLRVLWGAYQNHIPTLKKEVETHLNLP